MTSEPSKTKIEYSQEREPLRNVFQFSVKYAALLIVPAAAAIMTLSKPLVFTLFGEKYAYAPLFLTLCASHTTKSRKRTQISKAYKPNAIL